ncbi:cobyrinic acid a,c-diamide synthase [Leptospira hartskeerlii]|uniref:Cobyrinate a,c-diamide synthase n=1 Tax=Leptospira hartskeerlii TaxID=2023177 RepID=A0A2M9XFD0_9LEPT|nr:cobyrinate a,c-diamide synthase [Leptospira hartskeerlii]PJZ26405.1 cobyrinic acid a,c-diamide synthase [Leptospira hartskeerlii]PJZ34490.1 cobyrinic acid a,c-diamide synthase [Leptospira hartskeerlii]
MIEQINIPRILISGTGSGTGKTTFTIALTKALQARGLKVSVFKCGPDYLDPGYHSFVTGKTCQNLDGWLMGRESVISSFISASEGSDISIIEGVMGLFDGHSPNSESGSTAEISKWLQVPTIILIDASGMAATFSAIASGIKNYDPEVPIQGFVANFIGSKSHLSIIETASIPLQILGAFPKSYEHSFPERHLGLHSAGPDILTEEKLSFWKNLAEEWLDINKIMEIANSAPPLFTERSKEVQTKTKACKVGVAYDEAFHFYYEENFKKLREEGAELVLFSPLKDTKLPEVDGLYFGGGYPELFANTLSHNKNLIEDIRSFANSERPIYAECGGLMYLSSEIQNIEGQSFTMVDIIPGKTIMSPKLKSLGYVEVHTEKRTILGEAGIRFRGHQFRYSDLVLENEDESLFSYHIRKRKSEQTTREGYTVSNVLASYVHAHWASNPEIPKNFLASCRRFKV